MSLSDLVIPTNVVNNYLWHTLKQIEPSFATTYGSTVPFFPLGDSASGDASWTDKTYVLYDRMLRVTGNPFYPIKRDHIIYAVKGTDIASLEWSAAIQYILDRQDDAAQDINEWNRSQDIPENIYFHELRVFQADRSTARDWSSRSYYITEFVVDVKYHMTESIESIIS